MSLPEYDLQTQDEVMGFFAEYYLTSREYKKSCDNMKIFEDNRSARIREFNRIEEEKYNSKIEKEMER